MRKYIPLFKEVAIVLGAKCAGEIFGEKVQIGVHATSGILGAIKHDNYSVACAVSGLIIGAIKTDNISQ